LTVRHVYTHKGSFVAALLASFLIAASAHSACPEDSFNTKLDTQLAHLPECHNTPRFLAQIGHLLNNQGRYQEALEHLERAILFDPDRPETQLDYAIALAGSGDTLSASQLLDGILSQPQLSPTVRSALLQARQRLANNNTPPPPPPFSISLNANLRQGQDSNLLGTTHIKSLSLTLPDQTVVLELADNNAPRAGSYTRADLRLELGHNRPDGSRWELSTSLMRRNSPAVPEANTQQTELLLDRSPPPDQAWGPYLSAFQVNLNTDGGTHYTTQGLSVGLQAPHAKTFLSPVCKSRIGLEWQNRNFASAPVLSGVYSGVRALRGCATPAGGQWQFSTSLGQDRPLDPTRPGGLQTLVNLRGVSIWPAAAIGMVGALVLDLDFTQARDTTGYSALLDNAAVRSTARISTRVEYQRPLSDHLRLTLGAEWSSQTANIALFRVQSWGPYATLQAQW
jgi:hypothetical protein